jgi:predicted RNA-binding protein (virulence factor B family)
MQANGGLLPFNDRVAPEIIRDEMQMSKNEFKRAVGHLLKLGKIEIGPDAIRMK